MEAFVPEVSCDTKARAAYVKLSEAEPFITKQFDDQIVVDFDDEGNICGVENMYIEEPDFDTTDFSHVYGISREESEEILRGFRLTAALHGFLKPQPDARIQASLF